MTVQDLLALIPSPDRALRSVGLRRMPHFIEGQTLGILGLGLVVGASIALLFAPMTGRELRESVQKQMKGIASARVEEK